MPYARVERLEGSKWQHCCNTDVLPNVCQAEAFGLIEARKLWRAGAAGVRVTVVTEMIVLERVR